MDVEEALALFHNWTKPSSVTARMWPVEATSMQHGVASKVNAVANPSFEEVEEEEARS